MLVLTSAASMVLRDIGAIVESPDRFVDIGVELRVVRARADRSLETVGEPHTLGGILDTSAGCIVGPSKDPQQWQCSEDQWALLDQTDDDLPGKLALGGMGAGKTTAGVIWTYLRWLENIGSRNEMGITAPTETRLMLVLNELFDRFPSSWFRYSSENKVVTFADGFRARAVSTHRQSAAGGSRVAGFNWVAVLMDELQDQAQEFVNVMARLRSAASGRAKRLATATAKDDPAWRDLKDNVVQSGLWQLHTMIGPNSPFIAPAHWEAMRRSTTDRNFRRLVLAEDLPPESRLYSTFDRKHNVQPIPLGARKITSIVLARKTGDRRDALLLGHDPGTAKSATVWLDAYELPPKLAALLGAPPNDVTWWVRDELFTVNETVEQHATKAMAITRDRFGVNLRADEERAHVRCQPLGMAEDKPDMSVFAIWKRIGFNIRAAQYSKQGQAIGLIKKNSRFDMLNTLFCSAAGHRRLFIEQGRCPLLIAALETMERDHRGRGEHEEKDVRHDKSDLPASLGYALHGWERETASALRADVRNSLAINSN